MHFEITHEFDIALDALELAVLSPELLTRLSPRLGGVEFCEQKKHEIANHTLSRVWSFRADLPIPKFAKPYITKEMCAWDQSMNYDIRKHESTWSITPNIREDWQRYLSAKGSYSLVALDSGRSKRIVTGDVELNVPVVRQVAERMIVGEVRKNFDAEADTLRDMATLA
ncbi:MAG: DUF2505 family protein [Polyangiaceae bacterium]